MCESLPSDIQRYHYANFLKSINNLHPLWSSLSSSPRTPKRKDLRAKTVLMVPKKLVKGGPSLRHPHPSGPNDISAHTVHGLQMMGERGNEGVGGTITPSCGDEEMMGIIGWEMLRYVCGRLDVLLLVWWMLDERTVKCSCWNLNTPIVIARVWSNWLTTLQSCHSSE